MVDLSKKTVLVSGGNVVSPVNSPTITITKTSRALGVFDRVVFMLPGAMLMGLGAFMAVFWRSDCC